VHPTLAPARIRHDDRQAAPSPAMGSKSDKPSRTQKSFHEKLDHYDYLHA
jgi:hypothetical protein